MAALAAITTVSLIGGLAGTPAAQAARPTGASHKAATALNPFGMKSNVFGTKIVVGNVEIKTLKDALAAQKCTRSSGKELDTGGILGTDLVLDQIPALPIGKDGGLVNLSDLLEISLSHSHTTTYKNGASTGVKGINDLAYVNVGGYTISVPGLVDIPLPTIKLEGLQSTSDAFNNGSKFGHHEDFGLGGVTITIPKLTDITDSIAGGALSPLSSLLAPLGVTQDMIDDATQTVTVPVEDLVNTLIDAAASAVGELKIPVPGLGFIGLGLGAKNGRAINTGALQGAVSEAYALKVELVLGQGAKQQAQNRTVVQLGRAASQITDAKPAGVFRSAMSALNVGLGPIELGGVLQQSLPCGGTAGKTFTSKIAGASVLGGALLDLGAIEYKYNAKQTGSVSQGFVQTTIGHIAVPALQLDVKGLVSRVDLLGKGAGKRVDSKPTFKVGQVLFQGKNITADVQKMVNTGRGYDLGGLGVLTFGKVLRKNYLGQAVAAMTLQLPGQAAIVTLGEATGQLFYK